MSFACRRFRAAFTPGSRHPHRRACASCEAYAVAMERAAGQRLPLPGALKERLLAIPAAAAEARERTAPETVASPVPAPVSTTVPSVTPASLGSPFSPSAWLSSEDVQAPPAVPPVPRLPLPAGLRGRLLALPRQTTVRQRPPAWILSPRYAVAASYVVAVLLGAAVGDPAELGRRIARGVNETLGRAEAAGERRLGSLQEAASVRYREARQAVERTVERTVEQSAERLKGLEEKLQEVPSGLVPRRGSGREQTGRPEAAPTEPIQPEENDAPRPERGGERRSR